MGTQATGDTSLAFGTYAKANGEDSVAIGSSATVGSAIANSVALGASSVAARGAQSGYTDGTGLLANQNSVGEVSVGDAGAERQLTNVAAGSAGTDAVNVNQLSAVQSGVQALSNAVVKYDSNADGTPNYSSATLGGTASTDGGLTGGTKITNVAQGDLSATSTDAVNGAQLYATNQQVSTNTADIAQNTADIATNATNIAQNTGDITELDGRITTNTANIAQNTSDISTNATNIAQNSSDITALDGRVTTNTANIAQNTSDIATNATNIAQNTGDITALGGRVTTVEGDITTINGQLADTVMYDSGAHDAVTLGGTTSTDGGLTGGTKISNVAQGGLSATSTDAVNGSQLYATNQQVSTNTANIAQNASDITALDGRVTTNATNIAQNTTDITSLDGRVTQNTSDISTNAGNIAQNTSDITALDGRVTTNATNIAQITTDITSLDGRVTQNTDDIATNATNIAQNTGDITALGGRVSTVESDITTINGQLADAVMYDSGAHDKVTLGGTASTDGGLTGGTKITNMTQGDLSATSTDAVNGSQLYATNQQVSTNTAAISSLDGHVTQNTSDIATNATNIAQNTGDITALDGRVTQNTGDIATNATNIAQNTGDITALGGRVTTVEGDITTINGQLANTVMYDSGAHDAVTLGGTTSTDGGLTGGTKISNVAQGGLSATSTDAVNGAQLYATNQQVGQNTTDIAGNTTAITDLTNTINNGTVGLMQQDATSRNITVAKDTDGTVVDVTGTAGTRTVTGVSAGAVNATSVDAVNGSQLYATNQQVSTNTADISSLDGRVTQNTSDIATNANNIAQNTGDITALDGRVTTNAANITQNTSDITALDGRVTQNTSDIATNATNIAQNTGDITALGGRVTTVEGDITTINGQLADTVMYDSGAHDAVTLGGTTSTDGGLTGGTKISNVAQGGLSATSTDAVNGSQLYATNQQVSTNTAIIAQNTTDIAGNTTAITDLTNTINNGTVGLVQQDAISRNITVAKDTDGTVVDVTGTAGTRTVTGVSAGAINATSVDAVNGAQLYATNQQVSTNTTDISSLDGRVTQNTTDIAGNTTAITDLTNTINNGTVGLVQQDATSRNITVAKDTDGTVVDVTGTAGTRTVTGVSAGAVNATSVDAVNGSQLYATNQQVSQNATDIAGNTTAINNVINNGTKYFHANSTGADSQATGANSVAIGMGAVATSANDVAVGAGSVTSTVVATTGGTINGTNYTYAGSNPGSSVSFGMVGKERVLTHVAAGQVTAASTDAINGSQLYATNQSIESLAQSSAAADQGKVKYNVNPDGSVNYGSVTMGGSTYNSSTHTGGTTITNVADGVAASDAVNMSQLNAANSQINQLAQDSLKWDPTANGGTGAYSSSHGGKGPNKIVNVANGDLSEMSGDAVNGSQLYATNQQVEQNTTSINSLNNAIANINVGGAKYVQVNSTEAAASATGVNSLAVGPNTQATGNNSVAVGNGAQAGQAGSVALGSGSTTSAAVGTSGTTLAGTDYSFAGANPTSTVSVGTAGNERTVTNVAAGQLSASSTDAVNGSQLYATNEAVGQLDTRVTNVENSINGTISDVDNSVTMIKTGQDGMFRVSADNTAAASAVGTNAAAGGANAVASGNNSTAVGDSAQATANNSTAIGDLSRATASNAVALGSNSVADRANTVSVGSVGYERQITNVQAGVQQTDAVNVAQLQGVTSALGGGSAVDGNGNVTAPSYHVGGNTYNNVGDAVTNLDSRLNDNFDQLNSKINQSSRQANRGIASAAALVIATPYMPGRTMLNAGVANYRGETSLGVGVSRWNSTGRVNVNAGISAAAHDQPIFRVGVGVVLGD